MTEASSERNGDDSALARKGRAPLTFGRIVVVGGGCYGSWYVQQLLRAQTAGALTVRELIVVDRNVECKVAQAIARGELDGTVVGLVTSLWSDFLSRWLSEGEVALQRDALVPSPLMPHLLLDWLVERAAQRWPDRNVRVEPLAVAPRTPWQRAAPDGRHYTSFAEWMCPTNCVEPALCPATGGPRSWSMPQALAAYVTAHRSTQQLNGPVVFHCVHRTHGVGMIDAANIARADADIASWGYAASVRVLVSTASHCHGAIGILAASERAAAT